MKVRRRSLLGVVLLVLVIFLQAAGAPRLLAQDGTPVSSPQIELREAWERAREAGSYRFLSTVEQTMVPLPIPEMIGKGDTHVAFEYDGAIVLPDKSYLEMKVVQAAASAASVAILRDGSHAFMVQGTDVQPVTDPLSLASPSNDLLGFLGAAVNVTQMDSPDGWPHITRYSFDLDGVQFAEQVRAQAEAELRAEPGAPQGLTVPASASLRKLSGHGELWVSPQGVPVRQILDLDWPEVNSAYGARIHMVVDLSDYGQVSELPIAVQGPDGVWHLQGAQPEASAQRWDLTVGGEAATDSSGELAAAPRSDLARAAGVSPVAALLLLACVCAVLLARLLWRRPRRAYALVACLVAGLLVFTPPLQAGQVVRFQDRQAQAASEQTAAGQELLRTLGLSSDSTTSQTTEPDDSIRLVSTSRPRTVSQTVSEDQTSAAVRCGDPVAGADTDGDGLSDEYEICLGTSPYSPDTDGDGIDDDVELAGFYWNDRQWTSDPLKADTNGDSISDALEWSDMEAPGRGQAVIADVDWDGTPNIWDEDDDGDGVPDWMDLSPFATTAYTDTLRVSTSGAGFGGYEYLEVAVQPVDKAHLRYSTTALDWPSDDLGNIQDLDASTDDLRMLPYLLVTTNVQADATLSERYGFRSWQDDSGQTTLLVPLRPVEEAGAIYTFYAKVAYAPGQLGDIQWQAKMVWMAQVQSDAMDGETLTTETRILHQYEDTFRVTGLQVTKSQSYEAAVLGTPTERDDLYLFRILLGLSDTFGSYATIEGQEAGETALQEISQRFAVGSTATITQTFSVPPDYVAVRGPTQYSHQDAGISGVGAELVPGFLEDNSTYYESHPCRDAAGDAVTCATLLVAYEQSQGVRDLKDLSISDSHVADLNALHINLADVPLLTMRGFQLRMYEQGSGGWQLMSSARMMEIVEQRYASTYDTALRDRFPDLQPDDLRFINFTAYLWATSPAYAPIMVDGRPLVPQMADETALALNRALTPEEEAQIATVIDYVALSTGIANTLATAGFAAWVISDAISLKGDWSKLGTGGRAWSGLGVGLFAATIAASVVMGAISTACQANPDLAMCKNEVALQAANIAVSSLAILAQAQTVASLIISAAKGTLEAASKAAIGAQAVGMVIGIAVAWTSFAFAVIGSHGDPVVWRVALGLAIVTTIWLIVLFALNFIPIVGQIISAILALIDMIISLFTGLFTDETWSVAKVVLNLFYDAKVLTSLNAAEFGEFASSLADEALGMVGGNTYQLSIGASGEMIKTEDGTDDDLLQSWVEGTLLPQTVTGGFTYQDTSTVRTCSLVEGVLQCSNTPSLGYALVPKVNGAISFLAQVNYQYRWAEYGLYGAVRWKTHSDSGTLPDPNADDYEEPVPTTMYLDVPPSNLNSLWSWSDLTNPDRDGDGLNSQGETAAGTSATNWDSDGDGLSDGYEWQYRAALGCDPTQYDTDGDGLSDGQELRLGTRMDMQDTDGDGLSDSSEVRHLDSSRNWVGGWQVTLPGPRTAWVSSDPLLADADRDGLTDAEEMRNHLSPYAPNQPVPTLKVGVEPLSGVPGGRAGMYLLPGDTITVTIELENWAVSPVTTTLSLSLPSFFTDIEIGTMQGDREPPVQSAGGEYTWDFSSPYTLQLFESVSVTITARASTGVSTGSGDIAVDLPYGELSLGKVVSAVMDGDNPTVTLEAPADGALLRGTSYVVGGSAWDATTWVTGVELGIGAGAGSPTYHAASDVSPWAYTWSLPADGIYTLRARASDPMGHSSTSPTISVTVDNTPPSATLSVGSYATGITSTIHLSGTATDNLSGVERAQISINGQPWRSVTLAGAGTTSATWSYDWTVGDGAQGRHQVALRAFDRVGNAGAVTAREIVVDRIPPSSVVSGGADPNVPPSVGVSKPLTLTGVADEGGYLPLPAMPQALRQGMGVYTDTTVWLGLSGVDDNDAGVRAAWLGDINGDRLADLAVALPAADSGRGRVTVLYGRAGGWPTPPDLEMLQSSRTHLVGDTGAALGTIVAAAGDVNGDGFADMLVGEAASTRAFLVFGNPGPLGEMTLDSPKSGYRVVLEAPGTITGLAFAGDVNGDGLDDILVTAAGSAYLVFGRRLDWPQTLDVGGLAAFELAGVLSATGVGDVNGDQYADWVTTVSEQVRLFLGGDSLATPSVTATFTTTDAAPRVAAVGDVDANGYADLLYGSGTNAVLVYGNASASSWSTRVFPGYGGLLAAPGDADGDGRNDLILGDTSGVVSLVRRTGTGSFETLATVSGVARVAQAPYAGGADLNSDGTSDLALIPTTQAAEEAGFDAPGFGAVGWVSPDALPQSSSSAGLQSTVQAEGMVAAAAASTTRYVDDDSGCSGNTPCYSTIQAAVDASTSGNTIIVQPGSYARFTVSDKNNLTISGVDPDAVFIDGAGTGDAVHIVNSDGVRVTDVTIRNAQVGVALAAGAGEPAATGGQETNLDRIVVHSTQYPITMSRASALSIADSTLVYDGETGHSILRVESQTNPDIYTWATTPLTLPNPVSGSALLDASGSLYATTGGQSRTVYANAPGAGGALGDWTQPFSLKHYLPYDTGTTPYQTGYDSLASSGAALHQLNSQVHWPKLGGTANGPVRALLVGPGGNIYAGGDFTEIGGVQAYNVARWDGAQWHALGTGLNNGTNAPVNALASDGSGRVYVGGEFTRTGQLDVGYVAGWNGTAWFPMGAEGTSSWGEPYNGVDGPVNALLFDGTTNVNFLYIGGSFDGATDWGAPGHPTYGAESNNLVIWYAGCTPTETTVCYRSVGGVNGPVHGLALYGSTYSYKNIYVSGYFDVACATCTAAYQVAVNNVARYNSSASPSWAALGDGVDVPVYDLAADPTTGDVYGASNDVDSQGIYRWDGTTWSLAGGVSGLGHSVAADSEGNVYAGMSGGHVYVRPAGSTTFQLVGTEAPSGYSYWWIRDMVLDSSGHLYTAPVASGPGTMLGALSRWVLQGHYSRNVGSGNWTRLAYPPTPTRWSEISSVVGDGSGGLYALWGSYTDGRLYSYDPAPDSWTMEANPNGNFFFKSLVWANGCVYALGHASSAWSYQWHFYRFDPAAKSWTQMALPPIVSGANTADGLSWSWDGADHIYVLANDNTHFYRYRLSTDTWETMPSPSLSFTLSTKPVMARLGSYLYVYETPGTGTTANVLRYGAVGIPDRRLTVNRTALVAPLGSATPSWTNLSPASGGLGFTTDIGSSNTFVAQPSATWSPARPSGSGSLTLSQAAFVNASQGVYRLGAGSSLTVGYHQYKAEAHVYTSQSSCDRCGIGGDLTWGETAFGTIREAVESGAARVLVHPGNYPQPFYLVSGVHVLGSGAGVTIVSAPSSGSGALVQAEGVAGATLARLTLAGSAGWQGLVVEGGADGILVTRNIVRGMGTGMRIRDASQVEIVNNTIVKNQNGVVIEGTTPVNVRNTLFAYNTGTGLTYGTPGSLTNNYNGFWANTIQQSPSAVGQGNVYLDPKFSGLQSDDYRLQDDSPVIDAGAPNDPAPPGTGDRVDLGYLETGGAGFYASQSYSQTGLNDGLTWGVDAFSTIQDALDAAGQALIDLRGALPDERYSVGVAPGTWSEWVSVPSHVRLVGSGPADTIIDGGYSGSPVSFNGVIDAEVSGFTLQGAGSGGGGVRIRNAANSISISRNVIRYNGSNAILFEDRSTGTVTFNTIVENPSSAVFVNGAAAWATVRNNILSGNAYYALRAANGGLIREDYNLFSDNSAGDLLRVSPGDNSVSGDPAFAGAGYYILTSASAALDAADPLESVPTGGGLRADLGYKELLAGPVALLFGAQISSTVTANSGVAQVQVGWRRITDATQPVTATLPTSWASLSFPSPGQPVAYWGTVITPTTAGLYRLYTRATDAAGNEDSNDSNWYKGSFIVDSAAPTVGWVTEPPASTTAAAIKIAAQASDYIDGEDGRRFSVKEISFQVTAPSGTVSYPAEWSSGAWAPESGEARSFEAWIPLGVTGSHTIVAVAVDEAGNRAQSASRSVSVSGASHVATATSHSNNDAVRATNVRLDGYVRFVGTGSDGAIQARVDSGTPVTATLTDPDAALSQWSADVILPATDGSHTVTITPTRTTTGTPSTLTLVLDRTAPNLAVTSPASGAYVTQTVTFQGTASDGTSGVERVDVSVDGGYTWRQAELSGSNWSLSWDLGAWQDFVSYPARIRAVDGAGNTTIEVRPVTVDNLYPTGLTPLVFGQPVGQHLEDGSPLSIQWQAAVDAGGSVQVLLAVDQSASTEPSGVVTGSVYTATLNATGDWYVHIAARDVAGNQILYHYGPWHVRDMQNAVFADRRQSIVVDGWIDVDHDEWRATDLLGSDPRSGHTQELYTSWDGQAVYLGWSGAWWTLDGTLWAYLDAATGGTNQDVSGARSLPPGFGADLAVEISGPGAGALWTYASGHWESEALQFANGSNGDAEARIPWSVSAGQEVRLVAFGLPRVEPIESSGLVVAASGDENPWAVFPNTNTLGNTLTENYLWLGAGGVDGQNEGQPQARTVLFSVTSPQASGTAWCPISDLTYHISLINPEDTVISGLTIYQATTTGLEFAGQTGAFCPDCAPGAHTWTLNVPDIPAGGSRAITVTGRLASTLDGLSAVTTTLQLSAGSQRLTDEPVGAALSHHVDGQAPETTIDATPGLAVAAGRPTFAGTASDGIGSGIARVEVRVSGYTWKTATGTTSWSAQLDVPGGASQVTVEARAFDLCGRTGSVTQRVFTVDATDPEITFDVPAAIHVDLPVISGTTMDPDPAGALVSRVDVQIDADESPWRAVAGPYPPVDGIQDYAFAWSASPEDGVVHRLRARATDGVGNVTTTDWFGTILDNVAPVITVTHRITSVIVTDYLATSGTAEWSTPDTDSWFAEGDLELSPKSQRREAALPVPALSVAAGSPVLQGTVSDGSGVQTVRVQVRSPQGHTYTETASLTGLDWQYAPVFAGTITGTYILRVEALDIYGNTRIGATYELLVRDQAVAGLSAGNDGPHSQYMPTTLDAAVTAGSNVIYEWAFGDGTSASGRLVSHAYTSYGVFTATVRAFNSANSATASTTVVVTKPTGDLEVSPWWLVNCAGWSATFDITYSNNEAITLTDVSVVVTVPPATMVLYDRSTPGLVDGPLAGQVMWTVGSIAVGQSQSRRLVLHLYSSTPLGALVMIPVTIFSNEGAPNARVAVIEVRTDDFCQVTPTPTATATATPTQTRTVTPSGTPTSTPTATSTPSGTPTPTGTHTPTPTATGTPTSTPTPTATPTSTASPTETATPADLPLSGTIYAEPPGSTAQGHAQSNGMPLAGARIVAILCDLSTHETTSGADGSFELRIPGAAVDACYELVVEISARRFSTTQQRFLVADLRSNPMRDFSLVASWTAWLPIIFR